MKRLVIFPLFFSLFSVMAEIEQLQALNFGTLVVLENNEVASFRIDRAGNVNYSDVFRVVVPPQRAIFKISNITANTPIRISSSIRQSTLTSEELNVERFTFDSLDHLTLINSDSAGEATLLVGGQISTSGDGSVNFGLLPLSADYEFTIDY